MAEKQTIDDVFVLKHDAWNKCSDKTKGFQIGIPCWLKLKNGNIVLGMWGNNGAGATGWWKVWLDENGTLQQSHTQGYIMVEEWQQTMEPLFD